MCADASSAAIIATTLAMAALPLGGNVSPAEDAASACARGLADARAPPRRPASAGRRWPCATCRFGRDAEARGRAASGAAAAARTSMVSTVIAREVLPWPSGGARGEQRLRWRSTATQRNMASNRYSDPLLPTSGASPRDPAEPQPIRLPPDGADAALNRRLQRPTRNLAANPSDARSEDEPAEICRDIVLGALIHQSLALH